MSRELVKILRGIADIAEDNDKPNWANAMRQAAEYIRADLDKTLPNPVAWMKKHENGVVIFSLNPAEESDFTPLYAEPPASIQAESYSDALRSLASYVGCGGYTADDPIDAKEIEEKIRLGIDLLLSAQSQPCVRKTFTDFL